ncbi:MAG TPA: tetratricopeptide repeat protein [Candidatus Tectomicrobia bacterium]|jgi:regulator of sirC expression with transglutaminase-like and TPR domain
MDIPEIHRQFAALVRQTQGDFRLAAGALLIAQEEYPDLDIAAYLHRLDTMATAVKHQLGLELDPRRIVATLNAYLFDTQGFYGNQEDYYDPRNSFLNDVLDRKTGIPITLSVLYLELGRQVGLPIVGVGLPGHFIVQYAAQPGQFWIDPFHRGQILTRADCMARLQDIYGQTLAWHDNHLQPVSDHDILRRILHNLKAIYLRQSDYGRALSVVERLLLLTPEMPTEVRDRGLLRSQLGHLQAALEDLQYYLQLAPDAPDAVVITQYMAALRQQPPQ